MLEFTVNQDETAFVAHVEFSDCSCNVYAQIGNTTAIADCLADSIEEYISNTELNGPTQHWKEGDICLAQFHEDDVWYRARIRRKSGLLLTVFFIDYGNSDTVSVDCARKIPETLLTIPPLATPCIVSGCTPSGSAWTDAEIEKHRKTLENNEFKAKIMRVNKSGKETVLTIQLFQTDTGLPVFYTEASREANLQNTGIALQNLEIRNVYKVFISHVESASKFWVQLTENERELTSLMSDIAACFADDSPSSGDIVDPQPGQVCAMCYSEDGSFYRGMVKNVTNGSCNVIFIDYGNSETKPSDELFTLPQPLCKLPAQAVECSYHGSIDPSLIVHKLNELAAEESVIMKVVSKANHVYSVQIPSFEKSLMITVETESDANDAGLKSDGKVCLSYSPLHLQVGSVYDVCISCVENPGCFFIQIIGNGPKLDELMQSLDDEMTGNSPVISNCYIGLPCLANFTDGVWYRAEVVSFDEEKVQVAAVDFGFIEEFSQSQLRVIADKFKQLPAQSVQCTIDVSRTDESCWSRKDCDILTALTDKSALVAKVVAKKGILYQLDLYETDKEDRYLNAEFSQSSSGQSDQKLTNTSPVTNQVKSDQAFSLVKEEMPHIPAPELHAGLQVEVCVTAVKFPYVFGQITSTPVEQVAKLQLDLNTFYEKNKVQQLPQNGKPVVPGTFCCAQYSDGGWYRAMVTRLHGGKIEVTFVDFGDIAVKSPQFLYILKNEFCKLAQQCIKCTIKNLPQSMTQHKMEDILVTQRLDVKLLTQEDTVYPEFVVELPNTPVNRKLLEKLYEGQKQSPPREAGRRKRSFGRLSESDVEGYAQQEVRIGTTENVMVTHIYDPDHFHCVLDGMVQSLDQTMDQLHEHYSNLQAGQEALTNPTVGTPCVAQYSADMDWYRAKIISLLSNGLAEVMFVDYGNNECLSKDLLKAIKPDFMILPAQAILCGLADVSASQGFWSPEHIAQFEDLVLEQSFQATFRSPVVARDQPYIVNLVNKKGEEINRIFGRSTDSLCVDVASPSKRTLSTNKNTIQVNVQSDDWEDDSSRSSNFGPGGRSYGESRFGSGESRGGRSSGFNKRGDRDSFVKVGFGHDSGRGRRGGFGQNINDDEGDGFGKSGRFNQDHKEHFKRRHDEDEKGGFGGAGLSKDNNQSRMGGTWAASNDGNGRDRSGFTKVGAGHKGGSDDSSSDSSFGSGRRQFRQRSDGDSGGRRDSRRSGFRNDRFGVKSDDVESNKGDSGEFRRGRFGGEKGGTFGGERSSFRGDKRGSHFSRGGNGDNRESGRGFGGKPGGGRRGFSDRSEGGFGGKSGRGFSGKAGGGFGGTSTVERGFGAASSGGDDWDSEFTESKSHPHGFGVSSGGQTGGAVMSRGFGSQTSQEESWEGGGNTTICGLKITTPKQRFRGVSIKEEEAYVHYKLKLMETAEVYVVYTDSPSKFWCQVVKNSTDLQNLTDEINEEYEKENLLEELQLKEPKPGMPCAAKFSDDNMWYRGEIKKCSTSGEEVHFVDYGNTETVCLSSIRKLKPKFLHLPTQGLKCVLDKVSPSGGQWTDKAIEEFENLTADKKLFLKVLNTSADSAHMVMLEDQEENIDITQILIEKGYCTLPTDAAAKKIVSSPYLGLNLPLGTTTDVYVSWIENPHRFWCQPVSEKNTLDKLAQTLQEQYNSGIGANLTVQSAIPGMAVVSLFSEDGAWYRAVVEAVAGDSIQVQFVDYGNTDTVKLESLRRITEDLQIHSLAAICKLTGLRPLQSGWTVDAKDIMKQLVGDKRVSCKVLDKEEDCLLVELMVDGTNMGEELIRAAVVRADKEPSAVVGSAMLKSEVIYTRQGMKRYPADSSLDIGSSYSGYVAYVESISSFWCQLLSSSDELNALMQKLESFHNSMNQSLDKLEVGSACVAKYSEDQAWYRGRVDKVDSEGVTVFFVDYGNKEVISTSDVCTIWDEFLTLPTQAIHCSLQLSNVKCNPEMSKKLEELVMDQVLTIRSVKVNNDVYEIVLTLQDGTCVNDIFSSTAEKELSTDLASKYTMISYPKATYPMDKNIKVYLSHMESPSKFYVQLATQEDELNELMGKLKDTYSEEKQSLSQGMPGLACTAKFSDDGEWYRAEVIESHDTTLKLRFVDYGNCEETSLDLVKILSSEFVDIQPLAFQCCLQELDPIGEEWSSETITEFEALTLDKELTCNFNSFGQVRLQSEDGDIGEMLVNSGHARWRISSNICALDKTATSESSKESLLHVREREQALKEELLQQAESDKSNENAAMEEPEGKAETEWTFLSEESQLRMVCLEEGQRQTVMVSHCESPSLFWIQLESNKPSIDTLLNSMFDAYSDQTLAALYVDKVQEGDLVAALYADDESWYRAKVIGVASDQEVEVFFIDYGNSEIVPKDSLRKFMAQFYELPIQGLKCSLAGVNPKGNSWSDKTIDLFTELTQDKPLLMDVLSVKDEVYQVELMNMGLSISQQLLDQGDAVEKDYVPIFNKRVHQLFASDSSTPSKAQKEKQFRYKELDLDPKSGTFEVLLSRLISPADFWCQKLDYQKSMTEFDTRIQDSYSSDSETITGIIKHLGCVVLNTEDNKYYRGVVQKVNDKSVIVLCIDNGSEIHVPSENVKKLKSEFVDLPQQAFHCGLSDIISESLNGTWDVGACSKFHELVDSKPVKAELARHDCSGKYLLKLYDGDVSIAQALVDGGYARFRGVLPIVDKGGYKQLRLEVDDEYEVTLVDNDEMDKLVFHVLSQVDVIKGISERIAETVKEMEKTETELNKGDLCLVLNKCSDTWYRGVVQEKVDGQYEVYTLDYGSVMTVETAQILPLSKSLVSIPAQALICSMEDIVPEQNTTWTEESIDFFKEYCTEGRLFLYVSSYEDGIHYVVLSKEEAKGSVNALLVDLGFATAIPGSDIDLEVQEEHGEESFMELSLCRANSLGSINEETTNDLEETTTDHEESFNASMLNSDMSDDCILSESAVSFTLSEEDLDSGLKQKGTGSFSSKLEASTPYHQQTRHAVGELNSEEAIDDSSCPLEQEYCRTVASTMQDTTGQDNDTVKTEGYEKCPDFGVTKEHLDQGATKEYLDQEVKNEHPDQSITREDLDQGVTTEHLEQGVTKEHLDKGVTKECLDQYVIKEYLEECVIQDHKLEFPECKADKDVCSDGPKYSQDERGKQAGDNGMLLVVESQDKICEVDNDGQHPSDSILTENIAAIDDKVAKQEDTEKEGKDAFEMDIVDESTSKGTEDDGNRMGFVDVCPGIVLEKAKVQEDPGITNEKDVENTPTNLTPNYAKLDEMQSTGTEINRDENSESWFDAKEG